MACFLRVDQVTKSFSGVQVLGPLSLDFEAGEVHAIAGENGSGKSTLMKIIAGAYQPDGGAVFYQDSKVHFKSPEDALNLGIAMISQDTQLVPSLSVAENILLNRYPSRFHGWIDWRQMSNVAALVMNDLGLDVDPRLPVRRLYPDQQQLVAIARAISVDARVLIMDEPTASLRKDEVEHLFSVIARLKAKGVTILYVSHRLKELFVISDRISVLRDGRLIGTKLTSETSEEELVRMMVGRPIKEFYYKQEQQIGNTILAVRNLSTRNVINASFELREGEILGIAGLVGCGRQELLHAVFGCPPPTSGEIIWYGKRITVSGAEDAIRHGMVLIPADRKKQGIVPVRPVRENIHLGRLPALRGFARVSKKQETELADGVVKRLQIQTHSLETPIRKLSGGNQQKAILGRWMLIKPRLYLLDEPTRGIDVGAKEQIYLQLQQQVVKMASGILISSSELPELLGICDRIIVMSKGRIAAQLARAEATEEVIVRYATAG